MLKVLHISDPHFGYLTKAGDTRSSHRFVKKRAPDPTRLPKVFLKDEELKVPPDVVVISGDLTWKSSSDEYEIVIKFIECLKKQWPDVMIVVAPGNHDLDRKLEGERKQDAYVDFLKKVYKGDLKKFYPLLNPKKINRTDIVGIHELNKSGCNEQLLLVSVNTAAHINSDNGTPVNITGDSCDSIESKLPNRNSRQLRIFVLHHHILPFIETKWDGSIDFSDPTKAVDQTMVLDSARLQNWLASNGFGVALHGHRHQKHGRLDTLWEPSTPEGRQLFCISAGSAGVEKEHISSNESLSYNIITINCLTENRWHVSVSVRKIDDENTTNPTLRPLLKYDGAVGHKSKHFSHIYCASDMDDCHRMISMGTTPGTLIRNFASTVENSSYSLPTTAEIRGKSASKEIVESSFAALHPEYKPTQGWTKLSTIDEDLQKMSPKFRFQHGPRLFRGPLLSPSDTKQRDLLRPIISALQRLKENSTSSKAYVSLYDPNIDIQSRDEPMPGLMSIQFVSEDRRLDIVATFRKLELSFWWVVNMYEMSEIMKWAVRWLRENDEKFDHGHITFMAALAEWKSDPEAALLAKIDQMNLSELTNLIASIFVSKKRDAAAKLKSLLEEKLLQINENNLDTSGLYNLSELLKGFSETPKSSEFIDHKVLEHQVTEAVIAMINAITHKSDKGSYRKTAYESLEKAWLLFKDI